MCLIYRECSPEEARSNPASYETQVNCQGNLKDMVLETTCACIGGKIHPPRVNIAVVSSYNMTCFYSPQEEGAVKTHAPKHPSTRRNEVKREMQRLAPCCNEMDQNRSRMGKNRRALSLPLSPIAGLRHMPMHSPAPTPEALHRHYNQKEDDTDSASDLSDSERLPILPSPCTPCTPPHLNLRAEIINTNDFLPDFPGPRGAVGDEDEEEDEDADSEAERPTFSYPDFLPPPFNSWSLRQLAVFLHTEGR